MNLERLKKNYLYNFETTSEAFGAIALFALVTKTYPLSDEFEARSLTDQRTWKTSLKYTSKYWKITEIGNKLDHPEYFL